ncbi:MAG: patatin-like phospholipase family protein [Pontixanthobacter sp.]
MAYRIISIDGGGIRGIIAASLLDKLDAHCNLVKSTDMFAGTASGSLLALALAHRINTGHVMSLYEQKGEHIFDPAAMEFNCSTPFSFEQETALNNATRQGHSSGESIKSLFQAKYRADNFKFELNRLFGAAKLSELPLSGAQVMVEAMQLWSADQARWTPVSIGSGRNDPFADMLVLDAAMCSGATPTYFPPHKPEEPAGQNWGYFSGGNMHANNPAAAAACYAAKHFDADLADIKVLSIGTGRINAGIPPQDIGRTECWGGWQWIRAYSQHGGTVPAAPLVESAISASTDMCEIYAKAMLGNRYIRADLEIEGPCSAHDWSKLELLQASVEQFTKTDNWKALMDRIAAEWDAEDGLANSARDALSDKNRGWFSTLFG